MALGGATGGCSRHDHLGATSRAAFLPIRRPSPDSLATNCVRVRGVVCDIAQVACRGCLCICNIVRCLLAGSQGRVGGFLEWIAGTLARARAPGYGSGHKPAWFLRAPRGAKGGTGVSKGDGGFNHLYFSATCRYSSAVSFTRSLGPVAGPSRRRAPRGQPGAPPLLPSGGAPVISGPVKINYFLAIYS